MPKPQINGQYITKAAQGATINAMNIQSGVYLNDVKKRYIKDNISLNSFVNAYFTMKLMSMNRPNKQEEINKDCNELVGMIKDNFELELPLQDWFNQMLQSEEVEVTTDGIREKKTKYSLDEKKVPNINVEDVYESYGTPESKEFYNEYPEFKPEGIDKVTIGVKKANDAQRKTVADWRAEKESQWEELNQKEKDRKDQLEEECNPDNWDRIIVNEEAEKFKSIGDNVVQVKTMYAKVKQNAENRPWYDYILHPIRTYKENSLKREIEKSLTDKFDVKDLDQAFNDGVGYVQKAIADATPSFEDELEKIQDDLALGYKKCMARGDNEKKQDNLRKNLDQTIKADEKQKEITEKNVVKNDPNKNLDLE